MNESVIAHDCRPPFAPPHFPARRLGIVEQPANFAEGDVECPTVPDELQPCDVLVGIAPVARRLAVLAGSDVRLVRDEAPSVPAS